MFSRLHRENLASSFLPCDAESRVNRIECDIITAACRTVIVKDFVQHPKTHPMRKP